MGQAENDAQEIMANRGVWDHESIRAAIADVLRARDEEIAGLRQQVVARTQERNTVAAERDHVREEIARLKGILSEANYEDYIKLHTENVELRTLVKQSKMQEDQTVLAVKDIIAERLMLRAERDACVEALRICDIVLKAAKPCVNGGEHMNERIAEEALARLPDAGERARLKDAVIAAAREHHTTGRHGMHCRDTCHELALKFAALDAHDAKEKQGAGGGG